MVPSKALNELGLLFDEIKALPPLDIYNYSGDLMDAIFEINTLESYFSGIATKLIDGKYVTKDEFENIYRNIFDEDAKSLISITVDRPAINLESNQEVLLYAKQLDKLRLLLTNCAK